MCFEEHLTPTCSCGSCLITHLCSESSIFFLSFLLSFYPSLTLLFPPLSPVPTPWFLGPGQGGVSLEEPQELERGGSNGARGDRLQTRSCRLSSEEGYLSKRVWWGEMLTLWVTNGVFICADRELEGLTLMVWRPESHNKAGEFTQRTRRGGDLTDRRPGDQIGTASNCRKRLLDDLREFTAPLEWCSNIWTEVLVMILRPRCYPAPALQSNPRKKTSATFNKSPPRCVLPLHSPSVSPWLSRWEWNLKGRDTVSNLPCSHPPSGPPRVLFYWHHCTETWQANLPPSPLPPNPLPFPSPRFLPRWCHTPYGFQQHQAGKEI